MERMEHVAPVLLQRQQLLHDALAHGQYGHRVHEAASRNESVDEGDDEKEKEAEKMLKWLQKVFNVSADGNICQADGPDGALISTVQSKNPDVLSLDLTNAFKINKVVKILVTAMITDGTYVEGAGFVATLGENTDIYLELQLDPTRSVVDVYQPQMGLRTTDMESKEAVERGAGDGWLDVLPMTPCPPPLEGSVVVDASPLVAKLFYTFQLSAISSYRIITSQAYPTNLDLTVEYLSSVPISLGFSLQVLPNVTMPTRPADDRLLYFTSDYTDIGYHLADRKTLPSEAVDRQTSIIWRWDLSKLANRTIRMYVDPTVPSRWRTWIKEGVEAWNAGFKLLHKRAFVKAILPGDADWPDDYDLADARWSTISWSISDEISSEGDAKIDPRTGEIIKADIRMGEGWVWAWLQELDLLAPNMTHAQRLAFLAEPRSGLRSPAKQRRQLKPRHMHARPKAQKAQATPSKSQVGIHGLSNSLLLAAIGPLTAAQLEVLMGQGLRSVIMHEMGHILGLRHNFKGSTAISQHCLQNITCTGINSISSSVMDYLPMNLPRNKTPVHIFPPTIGEYDRLAILYGYAESETAPHDILLEAEAFNVCYDGDVMGEDPYCMMEDLGEDPVAYHEDRIQRLAAAQKSLHKTFVQVDGSWRQYGAAVKALMREALFTGKSLVPWIGGIDNRYLHRATNWNAARPRRPVPLALQRRALEALLTLLRPSQAGLLPPVEAMPFVVEGKVDEVESIDLAQGSEHLIKKLLTGLLSAKKLLQIRKQELLLVERNVSAQPVLTVGDFLTRMSDSILGGFHLRLDKAPVRSTVEMTLQLEYVRRMTHLYLSKELPESLEAQLLLQLRQLRADTRAAELRLKATEKQQPPVLEAHLALLNRELAAAFCPAEEIHCVPPRVRETLKSSSPECGFGVLAMTALVAMAFRF